MKKITSFLIGLPITITLFILPYYYTKLISVFLFDGFYSYMVDAGLLFNWFVGLFFLLISIIIFALFYFCSLKLGGFILKKLNVSF